jgi:hypothetical protein
MSVAIESLTQIHIISANPIPRYFTNFVGGDGAGVIAAMSGLINNETEIVTPIARLAGLYGFKSIKSNTCCHLLNRSRGINWISRFNCFTKITRLKLKQLKEMNGGKF